MIQQRARLRVAALLAADIVVLGFAWVLSYQIRGLFPEEYGELRPLPEYADLLLVGLPSWVVALSYFGLYRSLRGRPVWTEPGGILKASVVAMLLTAAIGFALKMGYVSRLYVGLFGVAAALLLVAARACIRIVLRHTRFAGHNARYVIVVGSGRRAREIARAVEENREWGLRLVGIVLDSDSRNSSSSDVPALGALEDLPDILRQRVVDDVIFSVSRGKLEELEEIFLFCEDLGIRAHVAANVFPQMRARIHLDTLAGLPLLTFSTTPYNELLLLLKRAFDVVAAAVLLLVLSPLLLATAIAVKLNSAGPVLFRQTRVGLNGRRFTFYKFRSMVEDAEARKSALLQLNEMRGPVFKMRNDPRVTRVGRFIRRTSIDELPQLWSVLKGDMSLVGPRPPVPEEVAQYKSWQRRRLSMKPGLTCLWQISGRNKVVDFEEWMELDLRYIDNWSLKLDLKIFAKTIPAVLLGRGAA